MTFPSQIALDSGVGNYTGPWDLDTTNSTTTEKKYYGPVPGSYGIEFHDVNNTTVFKVNESANQGQGTGESNKPMSFDVVRDGSTTSGQTSYAIEDEDEIICKDNNGTTVMGFTVDVSGTNDLIFATSGPTVTSITINNPALGPYNTGVGSDYYIDGTVISNDTIASSDITVLKDGSSYSNSNITMHNGSANDFELTKSGNGSYMIECGDKFNVLTYSDGSWRDNITANSSSRSNNAVWIRSNLSIVPSNLVMYISTRSGTGTWSSWIDCSSSTSPFYNSSVRRDAPNGWYLYYYYQDGDGYRSLKFDINEHEIDGHLEICGYFQSVAYDGTNFWAEDNEENPTEIGVSNEIISHVYTNDPNESRTGYIYDSQYMPNSSVLEEYQMKVDDFNYDPPSSSSSTPPVPWRPEGGGGSHNFW